MIYVASSGATANTAMGLRLKVTQSLSGLYVKENRVSKCRDTETDRRAGRSSGLPKNRRALDDRASFADHAIGCRRLESFF